VDWERIAGCRQEVVEEDSLAEDEELGVDCVSAVKEREPHCLRVRVKVQGQHPCFESPQYERKMIRG